MSGKGENITESELAEPQEKLLHDKKLVKYGIEIVLNFKSYVAT